MPEKVRKKPRDRAQAVLFVFDEMVLGSLCCDKSPLQSLIDGHSQMVR